MPANRKLVMQKLAEICVRRPVFATMLILSITVVGVFSFRSLGVDLFPKIDLPTITVTVINPGASPQEIETEITDKVEGAVNTVSGIDNLRSETLEGVSRVIVQFKLERDLDSAVQDVRDKIATVRPGFPRDVKDPLVLRADQENTQPVVSVAVLSKTVGLRDLSSLTDQTIVKGLENVPGVARIDVNGRVTRQILVEIKPQALTALGLSVDQVVNAIRAANQDVPAGRITRGASDSIVRRPHIPQEEFVITCRRPASSRSIASADPFAKVTLTMFSR